MREIVLDTETTGFKPEEGHRVVEIGCVELRNHLPTGERRQWYINPERDMPEAAARVHGLTSAFLADKPVFAAVAAEFLEFLADAPIVAHNASFDVNFLNAELKRLGVPPLRNPVTDTVALARKRFPGSPASLDALCKRFAIDNSGRTLHGALLDSQLLAECYLELLGGRQTGLDLTAAAGATPAQVRAARPPRPARPHAPSAEELAAHEALLKALKAPLWLAG
jgi:DNA polymerase-3 subunit epsilon